MPTEKLARAIADNNGETESELVFKTGDLIKVTSEDTGSEGWWEGELNGHVGYFPASFVTYNIDGEGADGDDAYDDDGDSTSDIVRDKTGKVLYNYEPSSSDDLAVKVGDVITYAELPDSPEWIDAKFGEMTGFIPKSYIEEISSSAAQPPVAIKTSSVASATKEKSSAAAAVVTPSSSVSAALAPPPNPTKKRPKTFYMNSNDIFTITVNTTRASLIKLI